jgi:hypothetical protein
MDGGLSISAWLILWIECQAPGMSGPWRAHWPDGKSVLEQPALTVAMFELISTVYGGAMKQNG